MQKTRRARGPATEKAILEATLRILGEHGYSALTIDRVAATARASKTTIYRRWKNKEHLVLALFDQLPIAVPTPGPSLEQDLITLFRQFAKTMRDSPLRSALPQLVAECINNPSLSAALIRVNEQRRAPIRHVLHHATDRGELPRDTDIELAIDVIQGAVAIRQYFLLEQLTDDWVRGLVGLLLRGIGANKPRRRG